MKDFPVFSFSAQEDGWLANSHYFHTPDGIFVFDTQLLVDYSEALLDQIAADTNGEEITSVFITHPHPDHYNGMPLFSRRTKAKFHSTRETARLIAKRAEKDLNRLKSEYKRRLPHTFVTPTELFKEHLEMGWKGLTLRFTDAGLSESPSNLICYIPEKQALISGDLIYNRVHLKLDDGSADSWRQALGRLKGLKLKRVYPGHGPVAGPEIVSHLMRYIDHFQLAVDYFAKGKTSLGVDDRRRIVNVMCDKYPDYQLPGNLEVSVDAEMARHRGRKVA